MLMHTNTTVRRSLTRKVRQLYSKLHPTPCLLCHRLTEYHSICEACSQSLPKLGPHCPRCAMPSPDGHYCGHCLTKPPIRHASVSLFRYDYPATKLITQFKFHHQIHLCHYLGEQLAQHITTLNRPLPQQLIPIPLHAMRIRQRGYNQAAELTKVLSKQLQISMNQHCLSRTKATQPQTSLAYKERKHNLNAAFRCKMRPEVEHIALIDDVLTSGHTADAAAAVLIEQGIKTIELWTIARTIRHYG